MTEFSRFFAHCLLATAVIFFRLVLCIIVSIVVPWLDLVVYWHLLSLVHLSHPTSFSCLFPRRSFSARRTLLSHSGPPASFPITHSTVSRAPFAFFFFLFSLTSHFTRHTRHRKHRLLLTLTLLAVFQVAVLRRYLIMHLSPLVIVDWAALDQDSNISLANGKYYTDLKAWEICSV